LDLDKETIKTYTFAVWSFHTPQTHMHTLDERKQLSSQCHM